MRPGTNRCDYVLRKAGHTSDGRPMPVGWGGDRTEVCNKSGSPYPHTYTTIKPGTTTVTIRHEGIIIRCPEHKP